MVRGLLGNGLLLQVALVAVAAGLASAGTAVGGAQTAPAVSVEVRVWQHVSDDRDIHISARPVDGSWRTLGTIPLPLEDGLSSTGRYRYGDIALHVRLPLRSPVTIEVRVWQDVRDGKSLYISARPADGLWATLGTIPLPLEDGFSSDRTFRYGDISLSVPLPSPAVDACSNGIVVPEPERNPGLVHDCRVLLEARDILTGGGTPPRWSVDRPLGEWTGITLGNVPLRVTRIEIVGGLAGRIPSGLTRLDGLGVLRLHGSRLSGEIPPELGRASNLTELDLSYNKLTGPIPIELASLRNLTVLQLGGNALTGAIPTAIVSLRNLTRLDLALNRLTGEIPPELATLTRLWRLGLGANQLTGRIPPELGQLKLLSSLELGGNRLSGAIPPELGELVEMSHLNLAGNELTGAIPPELGLMTNLVELFLFDNKLTGEIPRSLDVLPLLRRVAFANNPLTGCISRVMQSKLSHLSRNDGSRIPQIDLPLCEVTSVLAGLEPPLPHLVDDCSNEGAVSEPATDPGLVRDCAVLLEARDVLAGDSSVLNWSADRRIEEWAGISLGGVPRRVTALELSEGLRGRIPPGLAWLEELRHLDLAGNRLGGGIPAELGALANLETLRLNGNRLTGEVPGEVGQLRYLGELNLRGNLLSGEIPAELAELEHLVPDRGYRRFAPLVVDLAENRLTGRIPTALTELAKDVRLELSLAGNRLTGCIPLGLGAELVDRVATGLTYCQCPSLLLLDREYRPDLEVRSDGIPVMPGEANDVPGLYRLSSSVVAELPPGGRFLLGEPSRSASGEVVLEVQELTSHSRLLLSALTGEERSREVMEGPSFCSVTVATLFDRITSSARIQPLGPPLDRDGIPRLQTLESVEGGRSYRIDGSNYLVIDVPAGMRVTLESVGDNIVRLRDEESGSLLSLDATSGRAFSRHIVEADGRNIRALFDQLAASVREHPALPSCDDPVMAPDCQALLETKAALRGQTTLNWSATTPVESWQWITVSRWSGRVAEVNLSNRRLSGPIPISLTRLTGLERLSLGGNKFTGGIPPELGRLVNLQELYLTSNPLGGEIPPELGLLHSLVALNLYKTGLVGEIPEELGSLELLENLSIYGNRLEGCIPEGWLRFDISTSSSNNPDLSFCDDGQ